MSSKPVRWRRRKRLGHVYLNTTSRTQRPAQTALFLQLVQKLYNNPHLNKSFFDLDGGKDYLRSGKEGELIDRVPIVDT
jgi:hypothetical protein